MIVVQARAFPGASSSRAAITPFGAALERPLGENRPDVSAYINGVPVAIEVQISSLSLDTIMCRTIDYFRKGIAVYYRCTHKNKKQHCDGRAFVRDDVFEAEVKRNTFTASIPDEWFEKFSARIETWEAEASTEKQAEIDRIKGELAKVKSKIDRLNTAFADGSLEIMEFKELKNPLVPFKTGLEQKLAELEQSKANRLEPLKNFIFEANQAQKWVKEEN